ncbi:uncharacterized protein LOC123669762 [Melitaea cinxia]|uniref:uncharacterized protein LOC123669762 n=1 Tax=Melitaea cinxia TaxID=113334 RepID=UPI001E2726C5|nr:uncharacterized protein LOC123669762 [Melitaea cinxia]
MSCEIIIRHARAEDLQQRMDLVRNGYSGYFWNACLFFFFQELTLECCVLAAAILFIFFGVSATTCLLLLPAVAAIVAAAVASVHYSLAYKHSQSLCEEIFGIVAELKGALQLDPGARKVPIKIQLDAKKESSYLQVFIITSINLLVQSVCQNSGVLRIAGGCMH